MSLSPLVSVITPTYNARKYVKNTIESILKQDYKNIEYYITDDGSTDGTQKVISELLAALPQEVHDRIHYAPYEKNSGFRWHDDLLPKLKGKYICICSGDDSFEKNKIRRQVDFMEENGERVPVCFTWVNVNGESIQFNRLFENLFNVPSQSQKANLKELLAGRNFLNAPSMMFNLNEYRRLGGYNFKYRQSQDYDLWIKTLLEHEIAIIPEKLTNYTVHNDSLSSPNDIYAQKLFSREAEEILYNAFKSINNDLFAEVYKEDIDRLFQRKDGHLSDIDIQCIKVLMLFTMKSDIHFSVASRLYYDYSDSHEFNSVLQNEYGYTRSDIHNLIKKTNMYSRADLFFDSGNMVSELMDILDKKSNSRITETHIRALYRICGKMDDGNEMFTQTVQGLYNAGINIVPIDI